MKSGELWRPINTYEGYYEISTFGRVRSLPRLYKNSRGHHRRVKGRVLKLQLDKDGYNTICLRLNRASKHIKVHRGVALAFIPNLEGKPQVNHDDGDKTNNHVDNLEWATSSQNIQHAVDTNLREVKVGTSSPNNLGIVYAYRDDSLVLSFCGKAEMKTLGLTSSMVYECLKGKRTLYKGMTFTREIE